MRPTLILLAALPLLPAAIAAAAEEAPPYGLWLTEKKGVIVDLHPCGEELCGRTVWMKHMTGEGGAPRLDRKNPDPALRNRHWCGIEAITGLKPKGDGRWEGGEVYDPKTGETFDFKLKVEGDRIKARGYLGVPLFGKSETWTRADPDGVTFCVEPESTRSADGEAESG